MDTSAEKQMYGIWIKRKGWLRGKDDVIAFESFAFALQVARCLGFQASVRFIDKSYIDLEQIYLEQERRTLWHIFKSWFAPRNNTSPNS